MQRGGFSEDDIAKYFGRKDIRANQNYNHQSRQELAQLVATAMANNQFSGPYQEILDNIKDPIRREEIRVVMLGNVNLSSLGICIHKDGAEAPTTPERCAVCPGLAIIKGHPELVKETTRQLDAAEKVWGTAQREHASGTFGSGPWMKVWEERRDRLRMMLQIHLDAAIPDGQVIHLGNPKRKNA